MYFYLLALLLLAACSKDTDLASSEVESDLGVLAVALHVGSDITDPNCGGENYEWIQAQVTVSRAAFNPRSRSVTKDLSRRGTARISDLEPGFYKVLVTTTIGSRERTIKVIPTEVTTLVFEIE